MGSPHKQPEAYKPICPDYQCLIVWTIGAMVRIFLVKVHVFQAVWDRAARAIRFPLAFSSIAVMFRLIECGSSCSESSGFCCGSWRAV
ncbi:hypothetical protein Tco_1150082 [Tanacetum coccineum]|uniref:Uncharacterized protein n=1 Tax=Tanacetum coccineum TaxID=301880 RepID=A0ABQ5HWZ6_9ASTR